MTIDRSGDHRDKIKHLIILVMENRSFDHMLGALALPPEGRSDVEGQIDPPRMIMDESGGQVAAWRMDDQPWSFELPHEWEDAHADWNGGKNDGFVKQYQDANKGTPVANWRIPMGYLTRQTLPVLYALADEFTICDHWFASVLSSTWPNRKYLQSGRRDADCGTQTVPGLRGFQTTPMYEALQEQGISWRSYFTDLPSLGLWYEFALSHRTHFRHIPDFVDDCREDSLPQVSILDPSFTLADDHPPHDPRLGEKFIGLVVDALTHSRSWASSALLILYDEFGGFYDHVRPPAPPGIGPDQPGGEDVPLGFRVPAIVVSPYARKRYVSTTTYDHTSVMKSISAWCSVEFDAKRFGDRWSHANAIWDECFEFSRDPRPRGSYLGAYAETDIMKMNWAAGIDQTVQSPLSRVEGLFDRHFLLPELKRMDRRPLLYDDLGALEQKVVTLKRMAKAQ